MKLTRPVRRRLSGLAIGVLLLSTALAQPAYAAPPANDSIADPVVVSTVPARFAQDTRQATGDRTDGECVFGSSVWYKYRPTTTRKLRVVTVGSDFDTVLAVFQGTRSTRTLRRCSDDELSDATSAAALRFVDGETYWIAVSACCGRGATGGRSVLRLYRPRAAGATTTIDRVESGGVSGRLFVHGTTRCSTPSLLFPVVSASQRIGSGVARGSNFGLVKECVPAGTSWTVPIDTETDLAFQPGRISITSSEELEDGFSFLFTEDRTAIRTVVDNPNARTVRRHSGAVR